MKSIVVRQEDEADCGACCLLSILKYYGGYMPLEFVKIDTLTTKDGTNFYNIKVAAEKYGFEVSGKKISNFDEIKTPVIVQLKINNLFHFVVVVKTTSTKVHLMDPSCGKKVLEIDSFRAVFTGYSLELYPVTNIVNIKPKSLFLKLIKNTMLLNKSLFIKIFCLTLIICFLLLGSTLLVNLLFEFTSKKLIFLFILLVLNKVFINYVKNVYVFKLNRNISNILSTDYINHILFLPFKYLCLRKEGDLVSRYEDINVIKENISLTIVESLINILIVICTGIILYILNKDALFLILLISIFLFLILFVYNKKIYFYLERVIDNNTILTDNIISVISNLWTIKIVSKSKYYLDKIKKLIFDNNDENYKLNKKIALNDLLINSYNELIFIVIIIYTVIVKTDFSSVLSFIYINNYFTSGICYFFTIVPNMLLFKSAYRRINSIYYLDKEKYIGNDFVNGDICISNLTYINGLKSVFKNLNLYIRKGEKVLIKGANGSGKTTLLNILYLITYDYEGVIKIGKSDIKTLNVNSLRNHITYVNQNQKILLGTILDNIVLGEKVEEEKLKMIEDVLNLNKVYETKYNGINSVIKNNLSGGEMQKIILARALYSNFDILLLDEALSQIDSNERRIILNNICSLYKDKTIILVSHNKEYYKFDQMIFLNNREEKGLC